MTKVHNFSAGPAILPQEALDEAREGLINYKGTGLSVAEISHRSPEWIQGMEEAVSVVRDLLNVPDDYAVVFLQGGASTQFMQVPYNFLPENGKAAYLNTGAWSKKAIKEAKLFGNIDVIASSENKNFNFIPKDYSCSDDYSYLHLTSNNTIYGTQFKSFPECGCPVIADMSSDIFSRRVDVSKFGMIYAGAQKNMGPAGATLCIIRKDLLGKTGRTIPSMMDYSIHIDKESMYNTPPVFAIYLSYLTLKWLKGIGGIPEIEKRNEEKAALLYDEIDRNPLFVGTAAREDRSLMNVPFVMKDEYTGLTDEFLSRLKEEKISGLKGHRSVGGFRASIYNAMPKESVQFLVDVMKDFATKKA